MALIFWLLSFIGKPNLLKHVALISGTLERAYIPISGHDRWT